MVNLDGSEDLYDREPEDEVGSFDGEDSSVSSILSIETDEENVKNQKELSVALTGEEKEPATLKAELSLNEEKFRNQILEDYENRMNLNIESRFSYYEDQTRKNQRFQETPVVTEEDALAMVSTMSDREYRLLKKGQATQEVISKNLEEAGLDNRSIGGKVFDFVDMFLVRSFKTGLEDMFAVETSRGEAYLEMLADPKVTPQEMADFVQRQFDSARREGVLTSENFFAIAREMSAAQDLGYNRGELSDRIFGTVDVATSFVTLGLGKAAVSLIKVPKATNVVSKAQSILGSKDAEKIGENILRNSEVPQPDVNDTLGPSANSLNKGQPRPGISLVQRLTRETEIVKEIIADTSKNALGKLVDEASVRARAIETAADIIEKSSRPVHDWNIVTDGLGNYWSKIQVGTAKEGKEFKPIYKDAEGNFSSTAKPGFTPEIPEYLKDKAAEIGATVVLKDPNDLSKGFLMERMDNIVITDDIKLRGMSGDAILNGAKRTISEQVGRILGNNPLFGTPYLRDVSGYDILSKMGEGYRGRIKDLAEGNVKKVNSLNNKEVSRLEGITRRLRDGDDSSVREWFSEADFKDRFYEMYEEKPSAKELDAYRALVELSETSYILKSSAALGKYLRAGYRNAIETNDDIFVAAKRADTKNVPKDAKIFDSEFKIRIDKKDIDEGQVLWKLDEPTPTGENYILRPKSIRDLRPGDVYGYNAGGNRVNSRTRWFIMSTAEGFKPSAILGAFSVKQANKAVDELNTIQNAYRAGAGNLDDIIASNTTFSGGTITNRAELDAWLTKNGITNFAEESGRIVRKKRDESLLLSKGEDYGVWNNSDAFDFVSAQNKRSDNPLMEFGGGTAAVDSPLSSIAQDFGGAAYAYSNNVYAISAKKDWVETLRKVDPGAIPKDIPEWDFEGIFRAVEIKGSTPEQRRLQELKNIIERKLGVKDKFSITMERTLGDVSEAIFDKTNWRTNLGDPTDNLLKLGFQSAFGFFSPVQALIQGSGALNVIAISPTQGLKASTMALSLRLILRSPDEATRMEGIRRLAKQRGMSEAEVKDLVDSIKISGRLNTSGESAEAGLGPSYEFPTADTQNLKSTEGREKLAKIAQERGRDVRKYGGAVLDAGLIPFNAGERFTRLVSHTTAVLEWQAKNPGKSALSEEARAAITDRDHVLSMQMTTISRPGIQAGFMKVPTQWLSFSFRSLEAVAVGGRGLKPIERVRLAAMLGPFYGMAGLGAMSYGDEVAEELGAEPGGSRQALIRSGVIDGLSVWVAGDPKDAFSVGPRLAAIGALTEQWRKMTQEGTPQTLFGPSGEILGGASRELWNALTHLFHGRPIASADALGTAARQPSGINSKFNGLGILLNKTYTNKRGEQVAEDMSVASGIWTSLGLTPYSLQDFYSRGTEAFSNKRDLTKARKWVAGNNTKAFDLLNSGNREDFDKGIRRLAESADFIETLYASKAEKQNLRLVTLKGLPSRFNKLVENAYRHDENGMALYVQKTLQRLKGDSN